MPRFGARAGFRAALAGGVVGAACWVMGVAPARAAGGLSVTATAQPGPAGDPADEEVVSGSTSADTFNQVTEVDVTVTAVDGQGKPDTSRSVPPCGSQQVKPDPSGNYRTTCEYPYNGTYHATVVAKESGPTGTTASNPVGVDFGVYAPPAVPTGVTATPSTAGDSVVIAWKANTEPDVAYALIRDGNQVGGATKDTNVTDTNVSPSTTYQYQVVAARPGPGTSFVTSESQAVAATTPAPPPTTTAPSTTTPGTSGSSGGSATPTTGNKAVTGGSNQPTTGGKTAPVVNAPKLDFSSFASVLDKSRAAPTKSGAAALPGEGEGPDTGYNATLPFGSQNETEDGPNDPGAVGNQARVLGPSDSAHDVRPWAVFGFGVLVTAVLAHVLWMRSEVNRAAALEALAVDVPDGAGDVEGGT